MKKAFLLLATFVVAIPLALAIIGFDKVWQHIAGDPDMGPVNFQTLKKTPLPNQYLICPKNYCAETPDKVSDIYEVPAAELYQQFVQIIENDQRLKMLEKDDEAQSLRFLSRSPVLKFPDTTSVQVIKVSDKQSSIAIYARAQLGTSDLDKNKQRTEELLRLGENSVEHQK